MDKMYNAAVFVVPNEAGYCREFWFKSAGERAEKHSKALCSQKGIEFDPENDKLVQVWFVSKYNENLGNDYLKEDNLKSDNLEAHGFWVEDADYSFRYAFLPLPLIKDIKEDDTMDLEFEIEKEMVREGKKRKYLEHGEKNRIKLHITFDQRSYRYRNFGNFEDVVKKGGESLCFTRMKTVS